MKHVIWVGTVYAESFSGDGSNLNIVSNSIIQTILSNISALSKLCSSAASSFAPSSAAPSVAPTLASPSSAYPVGIEPLPYA